MVLIISPVSSLAVVISLIEWVNAFMERLASYTTLLVSVMRVLAWFALSAFCLVMEAISSKEHLKVMLFSTFRGKTLIWFNSKN
jgi:hypothetical protein